MASVCETGIIQMMFFFITVLGIYFVMIYFALYKLEQKKNINMIEELAKKIRKNDEEVKE